MVHPNILCPNFENNSHHCLAWNIHSNLKFGKILMSVPFFCGQQCTSTKEMPHWRKKSWRLKRECITIITFPPICGANINILLMHQALVLVTSIKVVFWLQLCFTQSLTVSHISLFFVKRNIIYGGFNISLSRCPKLKAWLKTLTRCVQACNTYYMLFDSFGWAWAQQPSNKASPPPKA